MGIEAKVLENKDYVGIVVKGSLSLQNLKDCADAVKNTQEKYGTDKILMDIYEMTGEIVEFDRYRLGEYAAKILPRSIKVAVIMESKHINKFFENVATNRGIDVIVVDNKKEALNWLLNEE